MKKAIIIPIILLLFMPFVFANFEKVLFWSEFPSEVDWEALNEKLYENDFTADIYVASFSRDEYLAWEGKINPLSNIDVKGVWPVLPLEKGYWFSGFIEAEQIDKLEEFRGIGMKIDIEPPFPGDKSVFFWMIKHSLKKGKNSAYLQDRIKSLSADSDIIVSSFPLPDFILRRMGFYSGTEVANSYMLYTSFLPSWFRSFYRIYYGWLMKSKLKMNPNTYFAAGLLGTGIFGDEGTYKSPGEFRKDLQFLLEHDASNLVVYSIDSLSKKEDIGEWVKAIKDFSV